MLIFHKPSRRFIDYSYISDLSRMIKFPHLVLSTMQVRIFTSNIQAIFFSSVFSVYAYWPSFGDGFIIVCNDHGIVSIQLCWVMEYIGLFFILLNDRNRLWSNLICDIRNALTYETTLLNVIWLGTALKNENYTSLTEIERTTTTTLNPVELNNFHRIYQL